jgi:hypothetical protein
MSIAATDVPKNELVRKYESMRASLRRVREDSRQAAKLAVHGVLTSAGGAVSGYMSTQSALVVVPGTNVPSDAALGSALMLGCALDMFDSASDNVASFAGGLLAGFAYREGQKFGLARLAKT